MFETIVAMERIDVQPNSTLRKRTVELCQTALNYIATTRKTNADGSIVRADDIRMQQMTRYLMKTFGPALDTILMEEVGLKIYEHHYIPNVYTPLDAFMYPVFPGMKTYEDVENLLNAEDMFSGTMTAQSMPKKIQDMFAAANQAYDPKTGKLGKTEYSIGFGITTSAFMVEECFNNAAPFTAEELASVILHEVGHGLTIVEHIADVYYRADAIYDSVNLKEMTTVEGRQKAVAVLNQLAQNKAVMEQVPAPGKALVAKAVELCTHSAVEKTNPVLVGLLAVAMFILMTFGLMRIIEFVLTGLISAAVSGEPGRINRGEKTSDTVVTRLNYGYMERIADEFVARHGLAAALVSALQKLYGDTAIKRDGLGDAMYRSAFARAAMVAVAGVNNFLGHMWSACSYTYDPEILRLENALKNHLVLFKNPNMDPALRNKFIKDTQDMLATIAKHKGLSSVKIRQTFWGTILRLTTRGSFTDGISSANLSADYDILQQLTNGLLKNPFYYLAARVQQTMEK